MRSQMEVGWAGIQSVSRFFSWYFERLGQNKSAKTVRSKETVLNFGATFSVELQSLDHFLWGFLPGMCDRLVQSGQCQSHLQLHFRSEEHTSELQSLMRISYAVFCLKKKNKSITDR